MPGIEIPSINEATAFGPVSPSEGRDFLDKLSRLCQEQKSQVALPVLQERFQKGLADDEKLFVSINLSNSSDSVEPVFVRVESWSENQMRGLLASDALIEHGFQSGDQISFNYEDVIDWTIVRNIGELFDGNWEAPETVSSSKRRKRPGEKRELLKLVIAALSRIKVNPFDTGAYVELARAHNRLGDPEKALTYCNLALTMESELLEAYRQRATASITRGDRSQALQDLERAQELDPQNGAYSCTRGWIFVQLGEYQQAIRETTRSLSLQSDYAPALYCRGKAYAHTKNYQSAIKDLSRAISLLPGGHANYLLWRGFSYACLAEHARAREDLVRAVALEPASFLARLFAGIAEFACGNAREALLHLNRAVKLCPESVEAYCGRGLVFLQLYDYRRAVRDFDTAIVLDQENFSAYKYRGAAYLLLGRRQNAIHDLSRALSIKPGSSFCLGRLSELQMKEGHYEKCVEIYSVMIRMDPRDGSAYSGRGRAYGALGMPDKELEDCYNAIAVDPGNTGTYLAAHAGALERHAGRCRTGDAA